MQRRYILECSSSDEDNTSAFLNNSEEKPVAPEINKNCFG
jgi:hypothetical protein